MPFPQDGGVLRLHQSGGMVLIRNLILTALVAISVSSASAATVDGVTMPDARMVSGRQLVLNGIGERTYSILGIRIYVAALYLEQRSHDAEAILRSPQTKLLNIRFMRDVGEEDARKSWRTGFANNCQPPSCTVNQADVNEFIAHVPAVHRGDESILLFTSKGAVVTFNGRPMGDINDPHFAYVLLRTFLGPAPASPELKQALLGL
jgi:Chalcone isomerase-like